MFVWIHGVSSFAESFPTFLWTIWLIQLKILVQNPSLPGPPAFKMYPSVSTSFPRYYSNLLPCVGNFTCKIVLSILYNFFKKTWNQQRRLIGSSHNDWVPPTHALREQKGEARLSANTGQREATLQSTDLPLLSVVGKVAWATRDSRDNGMASPATLHPY